MTQPTYSYSTSTTPVQLPKRKAGSRFTSGHLLMVVSALLAFLLSAFILSRGGAQTIVYIAKSNIIEGQQLDASQFVAKSIPSSALDEIYVSQSELTQGKKQYFATRSIKAGEPLLDSARSPQADRTGARLISIPIDKSKAVNGMIARGDRIDIIQTFGEDDCAFRALSNLEVVAAPASSGGGALGGGTSNNVITVSVTNGSDDLTIAGIISAGKFQIVKATGANKGAFIEDPVCGNPSAVSTNDLSGQDNG